MARVRGTRPDRSSGSAADPMSTAAIRFFTVVYAVASVERHSKCWLFDALMSHVVHAQPEKFTRFEIRWTTAVPVKHLYPGNLSLKRSPALLRGHAKLRVEA
jgi:hypothetical protein